jgi:hypothetical protein
MLGKLTPLDDANWDNLIALSLVGCASNRQGATTRPMTAAQRQDAALNDPFGYSPDFDSSDSHRGWDQYDREGMKKDLDHVFNP